VLEEMLFRGLVLRSFLQQYPRWASILGSACIFGFAHLNIYQFIVGTIVGLILGWLYERSRSLWPCILLHGAYNSSLTMLYFSGGAEKQQEIWSLSPVHWSMAFALAFVGTIVLRRLLLPQRAS
jgi:membrane protease YdiL (CAAX protease family)